MHAESDLCGFGDFTVVGSGAVVSFRVGRRDLGVAETASVTTAATFRDPYQRPETGSNHPSTCIYRCLWEVGVFWLIFMSAGVMRDRLSSAFLVPLSVFGPG
jgi:hypothetical protein